MQQVRLHQILSAWFEVLKYDRKLKVIGQYVYSQTVKRKLASFFSTWMASVAEIRHERKHQQLKKLIKQDVV